MHRRVKQGLLIAGTLTFLAITIVMLWVFKPLDVLQALAEYLYPTTTEMMPLPEGCVQTGETPPQNLLQLIETQRDTYQLRLQALIVCKATRRYPSLEFRAVGLPLGEAFLRRWRPLAKGCCSCQYRRHV
jgi:hypothetical protein